MRHNHVRYTWASIAYRDATRYLVIPPATARSSSSAAYSSQMAAADVVQTDPSLLEPLREACTTLLVASLRQKAERLRVCLQRAAHQVGLVQVPREQGPPASLSHSSAGLFEKLFNGARLEHGTSDTVYRMSTHGLKREATDAPRPVTPPGNTPPQALLSKSSTSPLATVPRRSDALQRMASTPQLGSPQRAGGGDVHNHPAPAQLRREQQTARTPKRRRVVHGEFRFPATSPHREHAQRLPNGHVASSLAQDLGLCVPRMTPRRMPISRGHARIASMPSMPYRYQDHYVPVRGADPVMHAPDRSALPFAGTPHSHLRMQSAPRSAGGDGAVAASPPASRTHRRSISHSTVETVPPMSHARTSGITTPPAASLTPPMTPRTMGHFEYGEYLNTSPSTRPRAPLPRVRGAPDVLKLSPPRAGHKRLRSDDFGTRSAARPLWARSSQMFGPARS